MQKVAIDLRANNLSGVYRYASSLVGGLTASMSASGAQMVLLYGPNLDAEYIKEISEAVIPQHAELILVPDDRGFTRDSVWLRDLLIKREINLYYSFNYIIDVSCPVDFIFTIHDLIRLKYPQLSYTDASFQDRYGEQELYNIKLILETLKSYLPDKINVPNESKIFTRYFGAMMKYLSERSLHIVTVSKAVKQDIVRILGVSPDKISVVSGAVDPARFYMRRRSDVAATLSKLNLVSECSYCIYVGLNHPHKRLPWLFEVLRGIATILPERAKLLIASGTWDEDESVINLIQKCGLENLAVLTRRLTDDEMSCLYSGAQALVVTSIDEGFCLPVLEALCCGCEVIVPTIPAISEVIGNHGHFYSPNDSENLAHYLAEAFMGRLVQKAQDFNTTFDWYESALQLSSILQNSTGTQK